MPKRQSPQKNPQSKVDRCLAKLSSADLEKWTELCRFNANYVELKNFLEEKGHSVSCQNISNWWISNRTRGERAKTINTIAEQYQGTNHEAAADMAIAFLVNFVNELWTGKEDLAYLNAEARAAALGQALRDLAAAATRSSKEQQRKSKQDLIQLGKIEMAEKLLEVFKDTAYEGILKNATETILTE